MSEGYRGFIQNHNPTSQQLTKIADEEEILRKNGVDPYVFVRFIRMLCTAFVPIWFLSWVILMPINRAGALATTSQGAQSGLDMFTFGSVVDKNRYWAHCILSWVFNGWLLWLVWREMGIWVVVRQRHLVSPKHSRLAQASTVLVTGIPKHYMDEGELAKLFSHLPGGVKRVWLSRYVQSLKRSSANVPVTSRTCLRCGNAV